MMEGESRGDKFEDDVSVIAVIGKENDRTYRGDERSGEKQEQEDRWVFELSDERCKMALRKQFDLDSLSTETEEYEGIEVLQKLPPGTIVIKHDKKYKDDSDYVRDSTETSSGGSTSGSGPPKVRRVHRATRKTRGTAEVRRNPVRVTKKDPDKDFPRPRQRLLSAKRKEMLFNYEPIKRGKSSTMPYMNTRSVTRKMYNVGATYHAPNLRDEMEWKEWPVHGMHERPVFHPQVGLAAEYLGRYFTSLDGFSYREIVDRPDIEVVSVDPRCDLLTSSKKRSRKSKSRSNSKTGSSESKSFESCMHESLHCVLGYCSQVMTPSYEANVEGKLNILNDSISSSNTSKEIDNTSTNEQTKSEPSVSSKEGSQKSEENKFLDNYRVAMIPQNVNSFTQIPKARLFPAQKVYVANSQKSIAFANLKTFPAGQMKIQDMMRSSKTPFILVNPSEVKESQILKPVNNVNVIKVEESSTEETLGELSSIYTNDATDLNAKQASKRGNKVEFTVTKYLLDNMQQTKFQIGREVNTNEKKLFCEPKELNTKSSTSSNKTWSTSDAAEIARILSEYNKSNLKKPAIENQTSFCGVKNIRVKELSTKEESQKQGSSESPTDRNVNITFPQGKWRRFHLTVEKLKDLKSSPSEKKSSPTVQNRQSIFKIDQTGETSDKRVEVPKFETVQRGQSSFQDKQSTSTGNDSCKPKSQSLQDLLENTAMLYCAATGTHQDDLSSYVDSLDASQSIQWLETCNNYII